MKWFMAAIVVMSFVVVAREIWLLLRHGWRRERFAVKEEPGFSHPRPTAVDHDKPQACCPICGMDGETGYPHVHSDADIRERHTKAIHNGGKI
jgi:hypothetical protein